MDTRKVTAGIIIVALLGVSIWWYLSEPTPETVPELVQPVVEEPVVPEQVVREPEPEPIVREPEPEPIVREPEPEPIVREPEPEPVVPEPEPEPVPEPELGPRIIITLPFDPQNPPDGMMPMGETVHHDPPNGHPGIDFQWYTDTGPPKIYSVATGVIVEITQDEERIEIHDQITWVITINHTGFDKQYYTRSTDLSSYNTNLMVGDVIDEYTFLGYAMHPVEVDDLNMHMIHWEFGVGLSSYSDSGKERMGYGERLCPLTYFDEDSRVLIEEVWEAAGYNEKDQFPLLCNGFYEGRDGELKTFSIRSDNFEDGERIPVRFTCDGENISPHLEWFNVPEGTVELAIEMHDPDAPVSGGWTHWIVFSIDPTVTSIEIDSLQEGSKEGRNSFGRTPYGGPCPPSGNHRYIFKIYALDIKLDSVNSLQNLHSQIEGHIIAEAKLTGLYSRS